MLAKCLAELGLDGNGEAALALHLTETRAKLRSACAEHGDNAWGDNLYLPDVIEKHLERHIDEKQRTDLEALRRVVDAGRALESALIASSSRGTEAERESVHKLCIQWRRAAFPETVRMSHDQTNH